MTAELPKFTDHTRTEPAPSTETDGWHRLHVRMIWVDAIQTLLSLTPAVVAVLVFRVEPSLGAMWPMVIVATLGVTGAVGDALRWVFTRYRVTPDYVERRTGVIVRQYRSVRRDRIRSVDTTAKLRHRLAGLRVVEIGAGQRSAAGESAFTLDAVAKADAEVLRRELLWSTDTDGEPAVGVEHINDVPGTADSEVPAAQPTAGPAPAARVFARFRPWWVVYNMFNIWAYLMAAGLLWGAYWLASSFGMDIGGFIDGLADWGALGWGWTIAIGAAVTGAIGAIGLGFVFFTENWKFELSRMRGEKGTLLRTRQGLFQTREVNRDDNRMRGVEIGEPLLWRWMGMADTSIITTGLDTSAMSSASTILPRGPISVARPVAAAVLDVQPSPLEVDLGPHPRAALRRRLMWGTGVAASVVALLAWLALTDVVPWWAVIAGLGIWPVTLWGAWVAYRALGHTICGDYVVVRSGLTSRSTAALQRKAVSTVAIRQSLLQRRLGLATVSAMTAAGWGIYEAPDVDVAEAVPFARAAAPGLLDRYAEPARRPVAAAQHEVG
ncbi:PH domain-containing protein [Phytoactinopolyspora limicola]|uniref:PH domain-containing protein n=1 Tax=Phytoactinopolyspora limicola TaxID=2715536 RepID=UPI0014080FF6|nr:PH domain-containing protein [Phytoactinopolyspora limicola]